MKTKMILLVVGMMVTIFANAQISIGVKTGVNIADAKLSGISESLIPNTNSIALPMAGINMQYRITDQLSFQPEINYVQRGFKASEGFQFDLLNVPIPVGITAITKLNYLEIPLQLKYKFTTGKVQPYIMAGPSLAYATNGTIREVANLLIDINIGTQNINLNNNNINRWEAGGRLTGGMAFETILGEIQLEGSYYHGLTDFFKNPIVDVHAYNKGFTIQAGWCYHF